MKVKANTTHYTKDNLVVLIYKNKEYTLETEFKTNKMFSGVCYMIKCSDNKIRGFDSEYFEKI